MSLEDDHEINELLEAVGDVNECDFSVTRRVSGGFVGCRLDVQKARLGTPGTSGIEVNLRNEVHREPA